MQKTFYDKGLSLSESDTSVKIANQFGLDSNEVVSNLTSKKIIDEVNKEFEQVQQLKVGGYPTLLLKKGNNYFYLGGSTLTSNEIEDKIQIIKNM